MLKRIIVFLIALLMFTLEVSAHPGRTDSEGGHINHSTGQYHYHHGYPEHQHPDGVCPYGNNVINDASSDVDASGNGFGIISNNGYDSKESSINIYVVTFLVGLGCVILYSIYNFIIDKKEKKKWKQEYDDYHSLYANKDALELSGAPKDVFFVNGFPATEGDEIYGDYTVYVTMYGKCYHQDAKCYDYTIPKHYLQVHRTHRPCSKCVHREIPSCEWFDEYKKINEIKKKYKLP